MHLLVYKQLFVLQFRALFVQFVSASFSDRSVRQPQFSAPLGARREVGERWFAMHFRRLGLVVVLH